MTMILQTRFSLLFLLTLFGSYIGSAQSPAHLPGQILVSLAPGSVPDKLIQRADNALRIPLQVKRKVSGLLNVWRMDTEKGEEDVALDWLRRQPEVRMAQFNHVLENRSGPRNSELPDDPFFGQQWHLQNAGGNGGVFDADLDAEQAWELATGGLSAVGDTIVIAVIDAGVDFQHPDLGPNAWYNWEEVPNDGIDNDGNGFIDDFRGWNVDAYNDDVTGQNAEHGTPVCGILGARGDNGLGVTGVNWQTKIMFVAGGGTDESVLAAYGYLLAARRRYNASNGLHGAFVTVVNCSWGLNYGQPEDAPMWCTAFDTLGAAGILSVAATANLPLNVDATGDLPTACPSDFLITVTSLQRNDQKASLAAWGLESIDLGAYGQGVFTLGAGNAYGTYSGTSFAAPQVAGAVALLYSMPCANLVAVAKNDPATAALWVKSLLLGSTTPNLSLAASTKTGGRLNLYNLLEDYNDLCNPCPAPFSLAAQISDSTAALVWAQIPEYQNFKLQYRLFGQTDWILQEDVSSPFMLPVSTVCQPYEFAVQAYCQTGLASAWSDPVNFTSAGCCLPPDELTLQTAGTTALTLQWGDSQAAGSWIVHYRIVGSSMAWSKTGAFTNMVTLLNLKPCTSYEVQVQSECNGLYTAFSSIFKFTTEGCGSCTQVAYCPAGASQSSGEWIETVAIDGWMQNSGVGGGGYQNFTGDQYALLHLHPLDTLPLTLTPAFFGLSAKEYFRIYLDYNADGDFDDDYELAFDPGYATNTTISGLLKTPAYTYTGFTRMRVLMKAKNSTNSAPEACEQFDFGQIEDYCVQLEPGQSSATHTAGPLNGQLKIYPQPATTSVMLEWPETGGAHGQLQVWNLAGQLIYTQSVEASQHRVQVPVADWAPGMYRLRLQTERGSWQEKMLKI